jgi:CheY-like chemotaxis protein/HPt (histidine-containing phosphotransfer) domain-containing protein
MPVRVLVVDDDALSREVLALLLHQAGYAAETADSGDAALVLLKTASVPPEVILADLQMPGTTGNELARQLRHLCGHATTLLAMSASTPDDSSGGSAATNGSAQMFDRFLRKPFTMETFAAAIAGRTSEKAPEPANTNAAVLNVLEETVYRKLAASMPSLRLEQLYKLCLADAEARVEIMRRAASNGDDVTFRREAHAIKGGCGMVGAHELQTLATSMEEHGLSDDHIASLKQFIVACERLRGMLIAREIIHDRASGVSGEDA